MRVGRDRLYKYNTISIIYDTHPHTLAPIETDRNGLIFAQCKQTEKNVCGKQHKIQKYKEQMKRRFIVTDLLRLIHI